MIKVEAIIRPSKLTALKEKMVDIGVQGMTVLEAGGFGRQRGQKELFRGIEYLIDFQPKLMLVLVTTDEMVDKIIDAIREVCYTGEVGDGKIFVYPLREVVRIRTGENGVDAV